MRTSHLLASLPCFFVSLAFGQVGPVNGMRPADPGPQAIVGATIIPNPGERIERGTVLIDEGRIVAIGAGLEVPAGYRVWNADGLMLYAALIEPALIIDSAEAQGRAASGKGAHWNRRVVPQVSAADLPPLTKEVRSALLADGFAVAQVLPQDGIFRGTGSIILLDDDPERARTLAREGMAFVGLEYGGAWEAATNPGSLMGALALERQTLADARWRARVHQAFENAPKTTAPPLDAVALDALVPVVEGKQRVLFDAADERSLLRQARVADEFDLDALFLGSGTEFRRLDELRALAEPIVVPPRTPRTPDVSSPSRAEALSLRDLWTWELAPTNAARLDRAGIEFAFTTAKLEDAKEFRKQVRHAIEHGLDEGSALAAVTTVPASILGIDAIVGSIGRDKLANLVLVDGPLFGDATREPGTVRAVWVHGKRVDVEPVPTFPVTGAAKLFVNDQPPLQASIDLKESTLRVTLPDGEELSIKPFRIEGDRFSCLLDGRVVGQSGTWRTGGAAVGAVIEGRAEGADGSTVRIRIEAAEPSAPEAAAVTLDPDDEAARAARRALSERPLPFPFGEYGRSEPASTEFALVRGATVWTAADAGILRDCDVLFRNGRIEAIGPKLSLPEGATEINAHGRHLTPGLIDCHSHTGIEGGVNEWTQSNTAECRIGDVIDAESVDWYRQLAGGLVAANQLHGSANPIGGQNSVVKIRWGEREERFAIEGAIPGIKFALGENVVRTRGRYPDTRMGVETFLRDAFAAAETYAQRRSEDPLTRPDLELDALVEILDGERIIHCHAYRQDEILMLLALAESFGFRIGTLQHVLEGFKVADAIAKHGAGASSFSDWWAYKMEVMDAIPQNGAILDAIGAITSFNSDSSELARRLNMEAAKAVRYGGMEPNQALKLVTANPAKQLRIDRWTGSIEVGKDADLVLWSTDPLSVYARVDTTWVEGVRRFDRTEDAASAEAQRIERRRLLAKAVRTRDNERSDARRERDRKEDASADPPRPRGGLIAHMLDAREAWYFELVRQGRDPAATRPGECGCGSEVLVTTIREHASEADGTRSDQETLR